MFQPIPREISQAHPELSVRHFNTLLIDASNLLEVCFRADKRISSNGRNTGGIYQFFLQIKLLLRKGNFRYCYIFFDGDNSGEMRYHLCVDYKANRDKTFDEEGLSDYMKEVKATVHRMMSNVKSSDEKEDFFWQRSVIMAMCEELCLRVVCVDKTEADDLIAWYVRNKKKEERIVICSNDRDITQLIHKESNGGKDDVIVYVQKKHEFVNSRNYTEKMGIHYSNVMLYKVLCGDTSDNIKGVKGLGETTLLKNFPEFKERKVTFEEVVGKAAQINEQRATEKKKPLVWAYNIEHGVTDGCQGDRLYDINKSIIDLSNPLMPDEAKTLIEDFMYAPMDCTDRTMANLYNIVCEAGVDEWRDESSFSSFFAEFSTLIEKEKTNSKI